MTRPNPNLSRGLRWSNAEMVRPSQNCSVCNIRRTVRFDEEIGYVCKSCMLRGPRCECGSGLPKIRKVLTCRKCYIDEQEDETRYEPQYVSPLGRAPEMIDGPGTGHFEGFRTLKKALVVSMKKHGIEFDSQKNQIQAVFEPYAAEARRRRMG